MKRTILLGIFLMAGFVAVFAQQYGDEYDLNFWEPYLRGNSNLRVRSGTGLGVIFSGTASKEGAGYVIDTNNLGLNGKQQITLVVSGISENDNFNQGRLFKFELNGKAQGTMGGIGMTRAAPDFINARNGEYVFSLTNLGNIVKINFVFYDCTLNALNIRMYVE